MTNFIPVNEPLLDGNEKKYLTDCIDSGWISSEGPFVQRFESEFAKRVGRKYGVAVSSGTAALDISVEALGIGEGDEVILPTFTIISCVHQIIRAGAKPVFVDMDPRSWNMNVAQIEERITTRTKAIIIVHIYGLPVDINPVLSLCKKYNLKLIEDSAEAIGQTYFGRPCGSFGDISTFSFYPNKHITTGEGGMICTDDDELAESLRSFRNLCFQPGKRFVHQHLGWNYRMTNLQAALGIAQLERLDQFLEKKRAIGKLYQKNLSNYDCLQLPLDKLPYADNLYWVFGFIIDNKLGDSESFCNRLLSYGIGTRPFFFPLHLQPVLRANGFCDNETFPHSEKAYAQGLYIPSGLGLAFDQIDYICQSIIDLIKSV